MGTKKTRTPAQRRLLRRAIDRYERECGWNNEVFQQPDATESTVDNRRITLVNVRGEIAKYRIDYRRGPKVRVQTRLTRVRYFKGATAA